MRLLIISDTNSDLAGLLAESFDACDRVQVDEVSSARLDDYDAFALLGGVGTDGITLLPPDRTALYAQVRQSKRIFAEYCWGIGQSCMLRKEGTRFDRPVLLAAEGGVGERLPAGAILDEQSNERLVPCKVAEQAQPILQYVHMPEGYYTVDSVGKIDASPAHYALWLEEPNLLVCAFRMANFAQAKFAPRAAWAALLDDIVAWLGGRCPDGAIARRFAGAYTMVPGTTQEQAAERAVHWFSAANQLVWRGVQPYAVREGMRAEVTADGGHTVGPALRLDCTGEASLMFFLHHLYTGSADSLAVADGLRRYALDMQVTEDCPQRGMLRGSLTNWWNTSYQDDAARGFVLPELLRALLTGDKTQLPRVALALDYLLQSTGTDGLRVAAVDFADMDSPTVRAYGMHREADGRWIWGGGTSGEMTFTELAAMPAGAPSAHYNAFYMAALLLAHHVLGKARYLDVTVRGITTLMEAYPNTAREHSETQELCRLILPLSLLYWQTGEDAHRAWLYRVAEDLQRMRHPSGGYREWDTGYTAICHNSKASEASAFATNGDPVCDMLYAINWLPMGFMVAHLVTGDAYFETLWTDVTAFFASIQLHSANPCIDGAWPRAVDMDAREVYGVPNDASWSPWTIESGWTVAEITSGMLLGLMKDSIASHFA